MHTHAHTHTLNTAVIGFSQTNYSVNETTAEIELQIQIFGSSLDREIAIIVSTKDGSAESQIKGTLSC